VYYKRSNQRSPASTSRRRLQQNGEPYVFVLHELVPADSVLCARSIDRRLNSASSIEQPPCRSLQTQHWKQHQVNFSGFRLQKVQYQKSMPRYKYGQTVSRSLCPCARATNRSNLLDGRMACFGWSNRRWKEWLSLPIKYSDLPVSSQLAITIWDIAGPRKQVPFGGTTYSIFNPSDKYVSVGPSDQ
jgi:hypothetical protein